jgi:hypothetical protein
MCLDAPSSRAIALTSSSSFKKETDRSSPLGRQVMTLTLGIDQNKDAFPNMLDMRQVCL